jgi:hypothetical protein
MEFTLLDIILFAIGSIVGNVLGLMFIERMKKRKIK